MRREEAIEVLKKTLPYESDFADAKEVAIEALEYLEKNKKWIDLLNIFAESCDFDVNKIMWNAQEWIPCSERLPEKGLEVLVSDGDDVWEDALHTYKNFYGTNIYRWRIFGEIDDTAWMPLPEPYKAESEE